jgi:hypothetical protein
LPAIKIVGQAWLSSTLSTPPPSTGHLRKKKVDSLTDPPAHFLGAHDWNFLKSFTLAPQLPSPPRLWSRCCCPPVARLPTRFFLAASSPCPSAPPPASGLPSVCLLLLPTPRAAPRRVAAMDVAVLRDRIQATLDSNADRRRQAELDLKYVSASTGEPRASMTRSSRPA